jgi:hypothetical protein
MMHLENRARSLCIILRVFAKPRMLAGCEPTSSAIELGLNESNFFAASSSGADGPRAKA